MVDWLGDGRGCEGSVDGAARWRWIRSEGGVVKPVEWEGFPFLGFCQEVNWWGSESESGEIRAFLMSGEKVVKGVASCGGVRTGDRLGFRVRCTGPGAT